MNKTKKIHPISVLRCVWLTIWLCFIIFPIVGIILFFLEGKFEWYRIVAVICAFVLLSIGLYFFFADFKRGIKFDNKGIKVCADVADKKGLLVKKFQHALCLKYEDITDISVDFSKYDTHNNNVQHVFVDMPNIVLTLKDGNQERINVYFYNLKQKIKIIDILKSQVEKAGNNLNLTSGKEFWDNAYSEKE